MHQFVLFETYPFTSVAHISCNDSFLFNSLKTRNPKTDTLENSVDPHKMPHDESSLFANNKSILRDSNAFF